MGRPFHPRTVTVQAAVMRSLPSAIATAQTAAETAAESESPICASSRDVPGSLADLRRSRGLDDGPRQKFPIKRRALFDL